MTGKAPARPRTKAAARVERFKQARGEGLTAVQRRKIEEDEKNQPKSPIAQRIARPQLRAPPKVDAKNQVLAFDDTFIEPENVIETRKKKVEDFKLSSNDPKYAQALNLPFREFLDICEVQQDKNFLALCNDVTFWRAKAAYQFPDNKYLFDREDKNLNLKQFKELFAFIAEYNEYRETGEIELRNVLSNMEEDIAALPNATVTFVDDIRKLLGPNNPEGYQDFNVLDFVNHDPQGLSGVSGPVKANDPLKNGDEYYGRTPDTINNYSYVDTSLSVTDPVQNAKEEYYYRREEWYEQEYARKYSEGTQPIYREYRLSMFQERLPLPVHLTDDYPLLLNSRNQPFLYHTYGAFNIVISVMFFPSANTINIRVRSGPGFHRTKTNLFPDVSAFKDWIAFIKKQRYYPRKLPLQFRFVQEHSRYVVVTPKSELSKERIEELGVQWDTLILGLYNRDNYAYELNFLPASSNDPRIPKARAFDPVRTASVPFDVLYTIALGLPYDNILAYCAQDPRFVKVCNVGFWRDKIDVDFMETDGFRQYRTDYVNYVDSIADVNQYVTLYRFLYDINDYFKAGLSRFDQDTDRIERDIDNFNNIAYNSQKPVSVQVSFVMDIAALDGQNNDAVEAAIREDRRYKGANGSAQIIARERLYEEYYQSSYGSYANYLEGAPYFKQYVFKLHQEQLPLNIEYRKGDNFDPPQSYVVAPDLVIVVSMILDPEDKKARLRVISYPTSEQVNPLGSLEGFTQWLGFKSPDTRKIAVHGFQMKNDKTAATPLWKSFGDFNRWIHSVIDLGYAYIIHPLPFGVIRSYPAFFASKDKILKDKDLDEKSRMWDDSIYRTYRNACVLVTQVQCNLR
jgi:hypothetical protein